MWCYRKILIIESSVSSSASFLCRPGKCTHWLHHVSMHHGKFLCTEWRLVKKLECIFFRSSIALLHIFFRNIISNLKAFLNSLGKHFTTSSRQGNLGVAQKNTSALWPAALADFAGFANWRSLRTDGRPKWSCRRARRKKTQCFGWGRWGSSSPGLYGNAWKKTSDSWAVEQLKLPGDIQRLLVICRVAHLRGNLHHLCIVTSATGRWRRPLLWRILHCFSRRPLDSSRFRPFPSCLWTEDEPLQGFIRQRGESDACLNRLLYEKGMLTFSKWGSNLIENWGLGSWVVTGSYG